MKICLLSSNRGSEAGHTSVGAKLSSSEHAGVQKHQRPFCWQDNTDKMKVSEVLHGCRIFGLSKLLALCMCMCV